MDKAMKARGAINKLVSSRIVPAKMFRRYDVTAGGKVCRCILTYRDIVVFDEIETVNNWQYIFNPQGAVIPDDNQIGKKQPRHQLENHGFTYIMTVDFDSVYRRIQYKKSR